MKFRKALSLVLVLTLSAAIFGMTGITVSANGEFSINSDGTLTDYSGSGGNVVVPEQVGCTYYDDDGNLQYGNVTVKSLGAVLADNDKITSVTIPSTVTSIGDDAFFNDRGLTSVIIPSSVTSIGRNAFQYNTSLTSVIIPSSVTSIGEQAFEYDADLASVDISSSVTAIEDYTFSSCGKLKSVVIPDSVTSIGRGAFLEDSSLTSVSIPSSVTSIGFDAFADDKNLKTVTINSTNTSIEDSSFDVDTIVIHGYVGSTAQVYAKKHLIDFEPLSSDLHFNRDAAKNYAYKYCTKVCDDGIYYINSGNASYNKLVDEVNKKGKGWAINKSYITAPAGSPITKLMNNCGTDCAHFVGRALNAGGLKHKFSTFAKNMLDDFNKPDYEYGQVVDNYKWTLKPGDIAIQISGRSHAMLITRTNYDDIFVTHHSGSPSYKSAPTEQQEKDRGIGTIVSKNTVSYIHITIPDK